MLTYSLKEEWQPGVKELRTANRIRDLRSNAVFQLREPPIPVTIFLSPIVVDMAVAGVTQVLFMSSCCSLGLFQPLYSIQVSTPVASPPTPYKSAHTILMLS